MPEKPAVNIKKSDIEIEFYRSSGPGGQHKNKTSTAVRMRHIPTGIVVCASERRSQHLNREVAIERLKAALAKRAFKPKRRIKTRVPESLKRERLEEKKHRGRKKGLRKAIDEI